MFAFILNPFIINIYGQHRLLPQSARGFTACKWFHNLWMVTQFISGSTATTVRTRQLGRLQIEIIRNNSIFKHVQMPRCIIDRWTQRILEGFYLNIGWFPSDFKVGSSLECLLVTKLNLVIPTWRFANFETPTSTLSVYGGARPFPIEIEKKFRWKMFTGNSKDNHLNQFRLETELLEPIATN